MIRQAAASGRRRRPRATSEAPTRPCQRLSPYNGEDFLVDCIESVPRQTYKNFSTSSSITAARIGP
jgi:hypothetical protein